MADNFEQVLVKYACDRAVLASCSVLELNCAKHFARVRSLDRVIVATAAWVIALVVAGYVVKTLMT